MTDDMIRDRLVLGTKDSAARGRMLREADLTLDKAINMCVTSERTSSQLQKLQQDTSHTEQAEVKYVSPKGDKAYKHKGKHPFKGQGKKQQKTVQPKSSSTVKCKYCGGTQDEVSSDLDSDSTYAVNSSSGKQWFVKTSMSASGNESIITCQLDSGSTCNVISFMQYARLESGNPPLNPTSRSLNLYGGESKLIPRGKTYPGMQGDPVRKIRVS